MVNNKIIVLGIDGMDFEYASTLLDDMPTLSSLSEKGLFKAFKSVFPPDSIPAWITCYTGKDPSEHGVLESVDYLAKGGSRLKVNTSVFQGKTFWDILGKHENQVCVINPFMAYPVWPVNGVMVNGPVFIDGNIQVSDPEWVEGIQVPGSLGGIVDFPSKKTMESFIEKTFSDTSEQAEFGLSVLKKNSPDFFFQTFLTMDRIQHFLWRYCDKNDPTYPGPNPFENSIKQFYIYIDNIIGKYLEALNPNDQIIIISDHGHGMRCTHCFNINEFLRQHGYLHSIADGRLISPQLIIEKLKNRVLNFMNQNDLEDYISVVAKFIPNAKKLKKGKHITQKRRNIAYGSDFAGTNPFGGLCINKELAKDYHQTRADLINLLSLVKENGDPIFKWIKTREEIFRGAYIDRLPDILFCLDEKYGVNWNLHTKIITTNPTHKKISGGHKEAGALFTNIPAEMFPDFENIQMINFFSTILDLFNIDGSQYSKGFSFIKKIS